MQTPQETRKATLNEIYIEARTILHNKYTFLEKQAVASVLDMIDEKLKEME